MCSVSGATYAFVEYEDEEDAHEAIKATNGYNYNGFDLRVEIARTDYEDEVAEETFSQEYKGRKLYVGNLLDTVQEQHLERFFGKYGSVLDVTKMCSVSGATYAFVEYEDKKDAHEAIKATNGYNYNGYPLRVKHARTDYED
eukprot:Lankesteria_metandrocarpae@DN4696_c0_g1_i4.p1